MSWTGERIDILKALWTEGLSASEIAKRMGGLSRNAVIGKVHRLGLSGRRAPSRTPKPPQPKTLRRSRTRRPPNGYLRHVARLSNSIILDLPPLGEAPVAPVTVLTLRLGVCHWPEGDPKDPAFHFCGRAADGLYCKHHEHRVYLRPEAEA